MQDNGDDLSVSRIVDFNVIFLNRAEALKFVASALERGFDVNLDDELYDEKYYDVQVKRQMVPTHHEITLFENELGELAEIYGGEV